ncbi:MAG: hypothetical protein ABI346_04240, partial [Candidatus Baltobacteraceae bacterium]
MTGRRAAPWSDETAREIGLAWLDAELAPSADFGRRAGARERPFRAGEEVAARAAIERIARLAAQL